VPGLTHPQRKEIVMTDAPVTWLRPRTRPGYTDTAALNDIHALLTTSSDPDHAVLGDVTAILARTGRAMIPARDITATVTDTEHGQPLARIDAGDTTVTVRQEPAGPGLLIEITTRTPAEASALAVTLDRQCLHHPAPPGGHAA
jgi:hypothetical protein